MLRAMNAQPPARHRVRFRRSHFTRFGSTRRGIAPSVLPLDVTTDAGSLTASAAEAATLLGGDIDVLCYTAGVGQRTVAVETSRDAHEQIMATNFEGAVSLSHALLPGMIERGRGNIVVVSSVQAELLIFLPSLQLCIMH